MLTRTQTKHQILNHINGCDHDVDPVQIEVATDKLMAHRNNGLRVTTRAIHDTINETR